MRSLIQAARDLIHPDHVISGPIRLEERQQGSKCQPITLSASGQHLLLRLDRPVPPECAGEERCRLRGSPNHILFPWFRADLSQVVSISDYLLLYEHAPRPEALFVFSIELKSSVGSGNRDKALNQLHNAQILADYLLQIARRHGDATAAPTIERRGIIFAPQARLPQINLHQRPCPWVAQDGLLSVLYPDDMTYPLAHFCRVA